MTTFLSFLALFSLVGFVWALISPTTLSKVVRRDVSRMKAAAIFGGLFLVFVLLMPHPSKQNDQPVISEQEETSLADEKTTPQQAPPATSTTEEVEATGTVQTPITPAAPNPTSKPAAAPIVKPIPAPATTPAPAPNPAPKPSPSPSENPAPTDGPMVKKSNSNLCHQKGTNYYDRTKDYTPYNTLQACLDSGGKMPQ